MEQNLNRLLRVPTVIKYRQPSGLLSQRGFVKSINLIGYVLTGKVHISDGTETITIEQGDLYSLSSNTTTEVEYRSLLDQDTEIIQFVFDDSLLHEFREQYAPFDSLPVAEVMATTSILHAPSKASPQIQDFFLSLEHGYETNKHAYESALLFELFQLILDNEPHSLRPWLLEQVSRIANVSREPIGEISVSQRLSYSRKLLIVSSKNITQIAHDCRFRSVACYQRLFRQTYGLSPASYRLKNMLSTVKQKFVSCDESSGMARIS